jgi:hypothetical protein
MTVDTLPIEMQNVLAKVKRQLEFFARENKFREGYDLIDITTRKVRAQKLDTSLQKAILHDLTKIQISFTIAENKRAKQSRCLCWL